MPAAQVAAEPTVELAEGAMPAAHACTAEQGRHVRLMEDAVQLMQDTSAGSRWKGVDMLSGLPREQAFAQAASFVVLLADSDSMVRTSACFALGKPGFVSLVNLPA